MPTRFGTIVIAPGAPSFGHRRHPRHHACASRNGTRRGPGSAFHAQEIRIRAGQWRSMSHKKAALARLPDDDQFRIVLVAVGFPTSVTSGEPTYRPYETGRMNHILAVIAVLVASHLALAQTCNEQIPDVTENEFCGALTNDNCATITTEKGCTGSSRKDRRIVTQECTTMDATCCHHCASDEVDCYQEFQCTWDQGAGKCGNGIAVSTPVPGFAKVVAACAHDIKCECEEE